MADFPSFEETQPIEQSAQAPTDVASTGQSSQDQSLPSFEQTKEPTDYSSLGQEALTGAESAAKGFAGPVATFLEKQLSDNGVPGLSAEEQEARANANPWIHGIGEVGGTAAGLFTGTGELGLLSKGAEAVTSGLGLANEASKIAKVGSAAVKGLIEMSGLAAGDEISKQILGRGDPEEPVAAALSNIGAQGLLGAATGGVLTLGGMGVGSALKSAGNWKVSNSIGQFLQDFGNRWKFNQENPNLIDAIYNELKDFHETTSDAASDVYGSQGLKNQAIEKLTSGVTADQLANHSQQVNDVFSKIPREIKAEPLFTTALSDWNSAVTKDGANAADIFKATDLLKRQFQEWSEYNKAFLSVRDAPFVKAAREVSSGLRDTLENSKVWNNAGDLQKDVNKAFSEYVTPLKDFRSKFTTKVEGVNVIDPQKIKTYVNMLGKTGSDVTQEIRPTMMKNYVEAAEKYRNKINDLHAINGLESPLAPSSLNVTKNSYGDSTSGGKLADELFRGGIGKLSGAAASAAGVGVASHLGAGAIGELAGLSLGKVIGDKLTPITDKIVGAPTKKYIIPALLKVMESGSPSAWGEAWQHADDIAKGNSAMQNGVDSIFTGAKLSGQRWYSDTDDKNKEKIKKFISHGGLDQQIQNSLQKSNPQNQPHVPHYAEGGLIGEQQEIPVKKNADKDASSSKLGEVYPEQSMLMTQAKGRVYNYLNSMMPRQSPSVLPFDESHKNPEQERSYDRAIKIADKPLSILSEIQKGTIQPEHIRHMQQMWPEVYNQLSKKLTKKMAEIKLADDKMPPYHVRQSLSMFLGSPLDSAMTPASIQAAQSVFVAQRQAMQSAPTKNVKNTSKLGSMNKQYQTSSQAAASRQVSEKR